MDKQEENENRLLNAAELEMVGQTRPQVIDGLAVADLQALVKRLRSARDRARRIASQQQREMRGKGEPRGAAPAADNLGTLSKTEVLVAAIGRVAAAIRAHAKPSQAQIARTLMAAKQANTAGAPQHPGAGRTATKGMTAKASKRPTVRMDPREVGRVSQATKSAQAKRDK